MNQKQGYIYATLAYVMWGFFPIYWRFIQEVPALEILCHRIIWAFVFYTLVISIRHKKLFLYWPSDPRMFRNLAIASAFIMLNWFVYIYGVNSNQIVETSLGYFINPLMNMLIGVFILKETVNKVQITAFASAALGVFIIALQQGRFPWLAFTLASSFAVYGLIKKTNPVEGLKSNQFESLLMFPISLILLFCLPSLIGTSPFPLSGEFSWSTCIFLICAGPATGLPLIFFAEAAQRLPMYLLGFFQFLAPSLQFLTGVFLFGESLGRLQLVGFVFIWVASGLVIANNYLPRKRAA